MNGEALCRRVAAFVARDCPPGLGRWDRAWALTERADRHFVGALDSGNEILARTAGNEVVVAWRRAAEEWRGAGCP